MTRIPVTIRLTEPELDALRAEAHRTGVTFSQLARERLGVTTGRESVEDLSAGLAAVDERVRVLEQLAHRDY